MLNTLLDTLTARARAQGLTDTEWARRAGVRKETLSRLRRRQDCDLSTLQALAREVGATLALGEAFAPPAARFPATMDRATEARLLRLAASEATDVAEWNAAGPPAFMAGLAVMLASERGPSRRRWLDLAERLEPGSSRPESFGLWLERSPLRPSRFLPMLDAERRHA